MVRLATLAVLMLSLSICAGPAAAKTWTNGQTASYTVRVPDGPAYRVSGRHEQDRRLLDRRGRCAPRRRQLRAGAPRRAGLRGQAERDGAGNRSVRWVEFASTSSLGHKRYGLFALDPRLVRAAGTVNQYYGF